MHEREEGEEEIYLGKKDRCMREIERQRQRDTERGENNYV